MAWDDCFTERDYDRYMGYDQPEPEEMEMPETRKETADVVAEYCSSEIDLGKKCPCVQARGYDKRETATPGCPICGGIGIAELATLLTSLDEFTETIDEAASMARDICESAKPYLDLAWWHTEDAIRAITGACSMKCKTGSYCACCRHYSELTAQAMRIKRVL